MSEKETNKIEGRITDTNERVLTLIRDIMSDFTDVVKMLAETMGSQLSIIKEQEKNNLEITRLHNQAMNRQLDIIQDQNGLLKKFYDQIDPNDNNVSNVVEMWKNKKRSQ